MNRVIFIAMACVCAATPAVADLVNGSFETGDLNGWVMEGWYYAAVTDCHPPDAPPGEYYPTDGDYFAWGVPGNWATLSQTFTATAGDTIGFDYFWLWRNNTWDGGKSGEGRGLILDSDGQELYTFFEYSPTEDYPTWTDGDWRSATPYTFTSSGSYTLQFKAVAVGVQGFPTSLMGVDNAKLTPGVVPVPGAGLLGVLGLSVAGWRLRRKMA